MGNGMNKILPGLYLGSFKDAKDTEQLEQNGITHVVAIHEKAKPLIDNIKYLCIVAADNPQQDLSQYFEHCLQFIHQARLEGGTVLVNCIAGVSRSATIVAAYMMMVLECSTVKSIEAIQAAREQVNPNNGFVQQLKAYQKTDAKQYRKQIVFNLETIDKYDVTIDRAAYKSLLASRGSESANLESNIT